MPASTAPSHAVTTVPVAEVLAYLADHFPKREQPLLAAVARQLMAAASASAADLTVEQWVVVARTVAELLSRPEPDPEVARILPAGWDLVVDNLERCTGPFCLTVDTTTVMIRCMDSPFIFEGVRNFLRKEGLHIFLSLHPTFEEGVEGEARHLILFQIEKIVHPRRLARLRQDLAWLLRGLMLSITDYPAFQRRLERIAAALEKGGADGEAATFARWLAEGNLIFLGYQPYRVAPEGVAAGRGALGMCRDRRALDRLIPGLCREAAATAAAAGEAVEVAFSPAGAGIRHHAHPADTFLFETREAGGRVRRHWVVGRLSRGADQVASSRTPLLRRKLEALLAARGRTGGRYQRREIVTLFNFFPKRELLFAPVEELVVRFDEILSIEGDEGLSVGYRLGRGGGYWAVTVALPRVRFGAEVVRTLEEVVGDAFAAPVLDREVALGDAVAVVVLYLAAGGKEPPGAQPLRERVRDALTTWEDRCLARLIERYGEHPAFVLLHRYGPRFPALYREVTEPAAGAEDIARLELLGEAEGVVPYCTTTADGRLQLRILSDRPLALMELIPTLRNLGLVVQDETQAQLAGGRYTVHVIHLAGDAEAVRARCEPLCAALAAVLTGAMQDDPTNGLILAAGLTPEEVRLVRTLRGYLLQVRPTLMEGGVTRTLLAHPEAVAALVDCFRTRFEPGLEGERPKATARAERRFAAALERVTHLADDEVLRGLHNVVQATVRTNYFQPGSEVVALKIDCAAVESMPEPRPWREIHVHGAGIEGCHLRGGPVARGGIRYSDRPDDFRTEILGLMKAQMVKNSVIVPVGSKGGFVIRRPPAPGQSAADHLRCCYQDFIRALLSVTDNLVGGRVVHPDHTVVYDGDDPYLVVAADKGTAHLSDAANQVSEAVGFWLGDAFASGGATGYDHKREGITARGAWECIKRHFRELDHDIQSEPFTCVGIGDMGGDVFGNGMLRSRQTRLVGAFNHRHIFLDPDPDPEASFRERERLFRLGAGWDAYDPACISPGGGVFERAAKRIDLAPPVRERLGTRKAQVSGEELIRLLLTAPVDLLYNGGIGTYVKASFERHVDVGDKANDRVRVDADQVRAKVIGEGGNLGVTQAGRLEYAARGGRINTDALDNSAGVDMSDHEVNLKLLCQHLLEAGALSGRPARDRLLRRATDEVAALCLADNVHQSLCVSLDRLRSRAHPAPFLRLVEARVAEGLLPAAEEGIPTGEALVARVAEQGGLLRPTLCVLLGYEKMRLEGLLTASPLPDQPGMERYLEAYFPASVARRFRDHLPAHRLRREIVATVVANKVVNQAGICFFFELERETGCEAWEIAHAYLFAESIVDADATRTWVAKLDNQIEAELQYELLLRQEELLEELTRRILLLSPERRPALTHVAEVRRQVRAFEQGLAGPRYEQRVAELRRTGVPAPLARHVARLPALVGLFDVIELHRERHIPFGAIAEAIEGVAERLALDDLAGRLAAVEARDEWEDRAKEDLLEEVERLRYAFVRAVLAGRRRAEPVAAALERFFGERREPARAYRRWLEALEEGARILRYAVVVHQLRGVLPAEGA